MTVLVLGGTGEARALANDLCDAGVDVVTSLSGGVESPLLPTGEVRIGGFGGVGGLTRYLRAHAISKVVDATHPFAAQMTARAALACDRTGIPLLRLSRPGWRHHPGAADWHWVPGSDAAKSMAERLGRRVFLSIGRKAVSRFRDWSDRYVLVRVVPGTGLLVPVMWEVIHARGPFDRDSERDLMRSRHIDVLVTKDSGGDQTVAKLDAAGDLGVPVVIVERPADPPGVDLVDSVGAAFDWVLSP